MTLDPLEVLSAFMDGEESDVEALAAAFAAPGAREALLDFVRLRVELAREPEAAGLNLREAVERELGLASAPKRRLAIAGIVAALFIVVAVGVLRRDRVRPNPAVAPPLADRQIHFTEGIDWFRQ